MAKNKIKSSFFEKLSLENITSSIGIIDLYFDDNKKKDIIDMLPILDIEYLKVSIEYKKVNKTDIDALYKINLKGSQECVLTLEPIDFFLKKKFKISFIDSDKIDVKKLDDEFMEPIINKKVNFGEIALQMLSLYINPYPRSKGKNVELDKMINDSNKSISNNNAFEVLNKMKK